MTNPFLPLANSTGFCYSSEVAQNTVVLPAFKKGQLWLMPDKQLLIRRMGKRLVEFKIFRGGERTAQRKAPASLETIEIVANYLQIHKAVLQPALVQPVEARIESPS